MEKWKMSPLQMLTAGLSAVFTAVLLAVCWRDDPSITVVIVLGVLIIFTLLVTVVDPSRFHEFSANLKEGGISFKATPEIVELTLKADAKQEKSEGQGGGKLDPTLAPLVIEAKHKELFERTDADYLTLATEAWRAKNFDDALRFAYAGLERPVSAHSITAALYSRLGAIEFELGQYDQAERHYRRALGIDPQLFAAHYNLGGLLAKTDRLTEAEASYREALRLDPGYAMAHNNLGNILAKMDRLPEAEASFREAMRLDSGSAKAQHNLDLLLKKMAKKSPLKPKQP